jgi:hypothetical protein
MDAMAIDGLAIYAQTAAVGMQPGGASRQSQDRSARAGHHGARPQAQGIRRGGDRLPRAEQGIGAVAAAIAHLDGKPARGSVKRSLGKIELYRENAAGDHDIVPDDRSSDLAAARVRVKEQEAKIVGALGRVAGVHQLALVGEGCAETAARIAAPSPGCADWAWLLSAPSSSGRKNPRRQARSF